MDEFNVVYLVAYLLVGLGLIGAVLPLLPGPLLIWCGALVWTWGHGFEPLDWYLLAGLGLLALVAWGADLFLTTVLGRRAGVSWKALAAAVVFGVGGGILLSELPVIGTLFGAFLGALTGMWLVEWLDKRNLRAALAAVRAYIAGTMLATAIEVAVAVFMVVVFAVRVMA